MGEVMISGAKIEGVAVRPLKQLRDERGMVMHMLRSDSPEFKGFGEVYFSVIKPGVVKAWKRHHEMYQNLAVPVGEIKLVIFDNREGSVTFGAVCEVHSGFEKYGLITIPPMLWYGFQGVSKADAMIVNCTTMPHRPDEVDRVDLGNPDIPYSW